MATEPARQIVEANASGDADDELLFEQPLYRLASGTHLLWFDSEQERIAIESCGVRLAVALDTKTLLEACPVLGADFNDGDFARRETMVQQTADERRGHIAATQKCNLHIVFLSPKIAVPTRTSVDPSAIAASRSCVMPIDSVSSENPSAFNCS